MPSDKPTLHSLPNEILLQVAGHLDGDNKHDLLSLALVSRKLRPVAQEVLCQCPIFAVKDEPIYYDPEGSRKHHRMLRFLDAVLDYPELAPKVKKLKLEVSKKTVRYYESDNKTLLDISNKCLAKLKDLGYENDPWYKMIEDRTESAFGGLLLTLLPNMVDLDIGLFNNRWGSSKDHPLEALYGSINTAASTLVMQKIQILKFDAVHLSMLAVDYPSLTTLELAQLTDGQATTRTGDPDWPCTLRITNLNLNIPIQARTFRHVGRDSAGYSLSDIFTHVKMPDLTHICINFRKFVEDFHNYPSNRQPSSYSMQAFLDPLKIFTTKLEEITLKVDEDQLYADHLWILGIAHEIGTLKDFTQLKRLVVAQQFLTGENAFQNLNELLPPSIEEFEIIAPRDDMLSRLWDFYTERRYFTNMKHIVLHCLYDVNKQAEDFWEHEDVVWEDLHKLGIQGHVHCQITGEWRPLNRRVKNKDAFGVCLRCNKRCGAVENYVNELDGGAEDWDDLFNGESDEDGLDVFEDDDDDSTE